MAYYDKLASAVYNNVFSALRGINSNPIISLLLISDECIQARLQLIKEYSLKGLLPISDLLMTITCIPVDCLAIDKCSSCSSTSELETIVPHFEIPLILGDYGNQWIEYIGASDGLNPFIVYTDINLPKLNRYRRYGKRKPYVYVNIAPNTSGKLDCYLYNAPLLKLVTVVAVFKDPRQLEEYGCCPSDTPENISFLDTEIEKRVSEQLIRYYRGMIVPAQPNNQQPR